MAQLINGTFDIENETLEEVKLILSIRNGRQQYTVHFGKGGSYDVATLLINRYVNISYFELSEMTIHAIIKLYMLHPDIDDVLCVDFDSNTCVYGMVDILFRVVVKICELLNYNDLNLDWDVFNNKVQEAREQKRICEIEYDRKKREQKRTTRNKINNFVALRTNLIKEWTTKQMDHKTLKRRLEKLSYNNDELKVSKYDETIYDYLNDMCIFYNVEELLIHTQSDTKYLQKSVINIIRSAYNDHTTNKKKISMIIF